ncbi:ribose 5-phosphate isomerase B [Listeria cornellensis]|uniref:Ribose 5-phosphate isomerase B n=1 Tax=Listeria cornellensis FSL F6-0969 TaxID=1265820 RepID=W7BSX4_9LIST|nr:ribose 5-phosphate isomerase B [Listeria cornellensis]EUJ28782.1 ribose 5-phosphate isomerase B [Listeria cornellensis FSL F6-0969]
MKITIGCDHGGRRLKDAIVAHLNTRGVLVSDIGTYSDDSVDFPSYAEEVANQVNSGEADLGILCCGTGIGMSIAANKVTGIRAAVVSDCFSAQATREHNDSNILCLGERVVGEGLALRIVDTWLDTKFGGERHTHRLQMITAIELKNET